MPTVIIIAGPNGAGKTTFADQYLQAEKRHFQFVNADEIARGLLDQGTQVSSDVLAGRLLLRRVDDLVEASVDFAVETTLASLTYAQKIPVWRQRGYVVSLAYLRLGSVEDSVARVARRMASGGHAISDEALRRRFGKSLDYFERVYKPIVDEWYMWDSGDGNFSLVEAWDQRHP